MAVISIDEGRVACAATPPGDLNAFNLYLQRWSATATDGSGLQRGDPTTITWGLVPDGTPIPKSSLNTESSEPSDLIALLDGLFGGGPGDLTQRPWFTLFEMVFERWSEVTGVSFVYDPADDGVALASSAGVLGVRPDIRIGGHSIDGAFKVLAYNYYPNGGDMVIDTDDGAYFGDPSNNYRRLRNTLAHEHGHGLGIRHVCPDDSTKLMEPFLGTSFDGPQEDDILAGNRWYGDFAESPDQNDTAGTATSLGGLGSSGSASIAGLSADGLSDLDFYAFGAAAGASVTLTLTPTGEAYLSGPEGMNGCNGSPGTLFDALRQSDLALELLGTDGASVLALADSGGPGVAETVADVTLPSAGTYFVRVTGDVDQAQMYRLDVALEPPAEANLAVAVTASADPSPRGASLWYRVLVSNQGPGVATGVSVTESLPNGVTFAETEGCTEDPAGVTLCSLGVLAPGEDASYSVRVTVDADGPSNLENIVTVSSTSPDPIAADDSASVSTQAVQLPCTAGSGSTLVLDADDSGAASVHLAEGTIAAGSGFTVSAAETVSFVAGVRVALGSGFSVESGGRLAVWIDDLLDCP